MKLGQMQEGDGYDKCAICGQYPVVNMQIDLNNHETFIAECPECNANRAEYVKRPHGTESFIEKKLKEYWNKNQQDISDAEMRHIEEANRKDGTEEIQDEKPTTETASTDGIGYKPCAYCGAKPVVELKREELKGRDCDCVKMEANCPNCPQNFVLRMFELEIGKPIPENELMKDWNDAQKDFEKLKAESVEDCDENDDSGDMETMIRCDIDRVIKDDDDAARNAKFTFGVKTEKDCYVKCPWCGCYPVVSLREGKGNVAVIKCPMCGMKTERYFDDSTTEGQMADLWDEFLLRIVYIKNLQRQNEMDDTARKRESQDKISDMCDRLKNLLLEKNRKYGDSALNPCRVFSKADAVEQIKVRMDDKLSRIRNAQSDEDEDVYMDLAGYLVLMMVAREERRKE